MTVRPAVALLEFDTVTAGVAAGDAMVKKAPLAAAYAGTVQPGHYLVLVGGEVAAVEEAVAAGLERSGARVRASMFLPDIHVDVLDAVSGVRRKFEGESLGVVETSTVAAAIDAADAGRKGADVSIAEIRMADGLGGKGIVFFTGSVGDVEAAVDHAVDRASGAVVQHVVIPQVHPEMAANLEADSRFDPRVRSIGDT